MASKDELRKGGIVKGDDTLVKKGKKEGEVKKGPDKTPTPPPPKKKQK